MEKSVVRLKEFGTNARLKLAGLWIAFMFLYVYCDIFSFHRTGYIDEMQTGFIGPFEVTQASLLSLSLIPIIPTRAIAACFFLKAKACRLINIIIAVLYIIVGIGNLVGETWMYYWVYGVLEILTTAFIVIVSFKWPKDEVIM